MSQAQHRQALIIKTAKRALRRQNGLFTQLEQVRLVNYYPQACIGEYLAISTHGAAVRFRV